MTNETILTELSKSATMIVGAVFILGLFSLAIGTLAWLWLKISKWLIKYAQKASSEFREAFRQVNGGKVLRMSKKKQ